MAYMDAFTDQQIIAMTLWGEARSEGFNGMQAVCNTMQNRLASGILWWGQTLREVAIHPWQYSCWLTDDPNRHKLFSISTDDPQYAIAMSLAANALAGVLPDIVHGADSYYADTLPKPPSWVKGLTPCAQIGPHLFFVTIEKPAETLT